jgi:hypothetical protein
MFLFINLNFPKNQLESFLKMFGNVNLESVPKFGSNANITKNYTYTLI